MAGNGTDPLIPPLRGTLRAIGSVVLPDPEALDAEGWRRAEAVMESALAPRPSGVKRQFRLFLRLLNLLPLPSTGRTFGKLPVERRADFLARLERSRVQLLRRGLWGVRTLLFMGYYTQGPVRERIGYGADPRGWEARRGEEGP
jgi:hypothetical protein